MTVDRNLARCVLNDLGECLAKIPEEACLCRQMPLNVWIDARRRIDPIPQQKSEEP